MREILFRGKREFNGEWIYGSYVKDYTGQSYIVWEREIVKGSITAKTLAVKPETVGQYTGVTDKNGRKIFEGDIVKSALFLYEVVWNNANAMFCLRHPVSKVSYDFFSYFGDYLTVIGSIHDNPEFIGGEQ